MLAVKPLLQLLDGKIHPLESVRTKKKAIATMLSILEQDVAGKEHIHATIFHGVAEEDAQMVYDQITETIKPERLILSKLSPVIGVHTGPGTIGISYYTE
jgi:DegV family protein with EDD domain